MFDEAVRSCSICRKPAISATFIETRPNVVDEGRLYDIECGDCGFYRISAARLMTMARQTDAHRSGLRHLIRTANNGGNQYCINDGRELPLTNLQRVAVGQFRPGAMTFE